VKFDLRLGRRLVKFTLFGLEQVGEPIPEVAGKEWNFVPWTALSGSLVRALLLANRLVQGGLGHVRKANHRSKLPPSVSFDEGVEILACQMSGGKEAETVAIALRCEDGIDGLIDCLFERRQVLVKIGLVGGVRKWSFLASLNLSENSECPLHCVGRTTASFGTH
jgi:hypothetical protein